MITVLFDTNILHQEGLDSTRIQRFQRLLKASEVKLILPEIVIEEFRSKRISVAEQEFSRIEKSIGTLQKRGIWKSDNIFKSMYSLNDTLSCCVENITSTIDNWIETYEIEIYNISNTCIDKLFKDYFSGVVGRICC